jgi:hypothetical protein
MRERVSINRIRAEMFKHTAHNAFAGRDIPCQTNNVFPRPITHKNSIVLVVLLSILILMSFMKNSNEI